MEANASFEEDGKALFKAHAYGQIIILFEMGIRRDRTASPF